MISDILKNEREKKQVTQQQVATEILVSQKTISNWESGRTLPDIENIIRLAQYYQLSLDDLLLEGSDIVEEMQTQKKIAELSQLYFGGPVVTGILLIVLMYLSPEMTNLANVTVIGLASLTNGLSLCYFRQKLYQLRGKEEKLRKELAQAKKMFLIFTILLGLFLMYLLSL